MVGWTGGAGDCMGGVARLARSRDIVEMAMRHIAENETVFLHPPGVDAECDEARASIAVRR